jgi:acyl carrier protein
MTDIRARIVSTIHDITKPEKPDLSDHSKSLLAGALDSLDYASVLMALEDEFGVSITEESTEELGSIDQLVAVIVARQAA